MTSVAPYRVTRPRIGWSAPTAPAPSGFTGCSSSPVQQSTDPGWGLHGSLAYVSAANLTEFRAQWCGGLGDGSGDLSLNRSLADELVVGHSYEMVLDYTVVGPVGGGRFGMVIQPATTNFPSVGVGAHTQTIPFTFTGTPFVVLIGIGELGVNIGYPVHRMTIQSLVLTDLTASAVVDLTPAIGTVAETDFIEFGFPLFNARAWCEPCAGSELVAYPSGIEDGWLEQLTQYLQGDVPYVPATDSVTSFGPATGWDGVAGWQRFLPLAQGGRPFYFWRDATDAGSKLLCVLDEPKGPPAPDLGLLRRFTIRLRTVAGERFTGY